MFKPKVMLVIMDGWGYSPVHPGNAVWAAKTPNFDYFWNHYAHTLLNAFGESVGLPWGSIGSSEVGHMSIGSGRLVHQELSLIDREIESGDFYKEKVINEFVKDANKSNKPIHLIGLVSDGGVHSHMSHLYSLLRVIKNNEFKSNVFIHVITDGRDTAPQSAEQYLSELEREIKKIGIDARIATMTGRYYSMDRDNRWERTSAAYLAMTQNKGEHAPDFRTALSNSYQEKLTDEFVKPTIIESKNKTSLLGKLLGRSENDSMGQIKKGDSLIFFNIRPDRMRQITEMFLFPKKHLDVEFVPDLKVLTLSTYDELLPVKVAFPATKVKEPLAKILSDHGISQAHFAETEKYAHVTYFFNGGNPEPFKGESWNLVPSPNVPTYDEKPEMSADEVTDKLFEIIEKEKPEFVVVNYANADMVGHTGVFDKVVTAVETVDKQIGRLKEFLPETTLLITADHGNAECMIHPETGEIDKKHTVNPVPFILVSPEFERKQSEQIDSINPSGILADIAPTILNIFDIKKTSEMNGENIMDTLRLSDSK